MQIYTVDCSLRLSPDAEMLYNFQPACTTGVDSEQSLLYQVAGSGSMKKTCNCGSYITKNLEDSTCFRELVGD